LHQQLKNPDFVDKIDYVPYRQFDALMVGGEFAPDTIVADPSTHSATFVPLMAGSDKTTLSMAIGHQEYHPVYQSPGVLTGVARGSHGNGVLPVAFLPIPKSNLYLSSRL
ncbi:hypothetical protein B0H16DRAFT_1307410, partial [Mycena metata]